MGIGGPASKSCYWSLYSNVLGNCLLCHKTLLFASRLPALMNNSLPIIKSCAPVIVFAKTITPPRASFNPHPCTGVTVAIFKPLQRPLDKGGRLLMITQNGLSKSFLHTFHFPLRISLPAFYNFSTSLYSSVQFSSVQSSLVQFSSVQFRTFVVLFLGSYAGMNAQPTMPKRQT